MLEENRGGFALVLSDVLMLAMDGAAFTRTVRDRYPDLPTLSCTDLSAAVAEHGSDGVALLHKAFEIEDLARAPHEATIACRPVLADSDEPAAKGAATAMQP